MRNDFETASEARGYIFKYGRKDFLNLMDDVDTGKIYIYMDPAKITPIRSDTGATEGNQAEGKFMMLQKGSLDAMYDETLNKEGVTTKAKYQHIIEPMIPKLEQLVQSVENCGENWEIQYSYTEVINIDDLVMDGLLVTYKAKSF